jgi:hypothetical protein
MAVYRIFKQHSYRRRGDFNVWHLFTRKLGKLMTWRQLAAIDLVEVWHNSNNLETKLCHQNCNHEASKSRLNARNGYYHSV